VFPIVLLKGNALNILIGQLATSFYLPSVQFFLKMRQEIGLKSAPAGHILHLKFEKFFRTDGKEQAPFHTSPTT